MHGSIFLALESQESLQDIGIALSASCGLARSRSLVATRRWNREVKLRSPLHPFYETVSCSNFERQF